MYIFLAECIKLESRLLNFRRCGIQVDGHFARVNITRNQLMGNQCPKGVLTIGGMEKEFLVAYNVIERNIARYAVEIFINSHSEQFSQVIKPFFPICFICTGYKYITILSHRHRK